MSGCRKFRKSLKKHFPDFPEGWPDGRQMEHLRDCDSCSSYFRQYQQAEQLLKSDINPPSFPVWEDVIHNLEKTGKSGSSFLNRTTVRRLGWALAAAAVAVVVLLQNFELHRPGDSVPDSTRVVSAFVRERTADVIQIQDSAANMDAVWIASLQEEKDETD